MQTRLFSSIYNILVGWMIAEGTCKDPRASSQNWKVFFRILQIILAVLSSS